MSELQKTNEKLKELELCRLKKHEMNLIINKNNPDISTESCYTCIKIWIFYHNELIGYKEDFN